SAGLLIRSFLRLQAVDPGFQPEGVLLVRVSLPPDQQKASGQAVVTHQQQIFDQFAERIAAIPGIKSAGAVSNLLIKGTPDETIEIEGRPMSKEEDASQLASSAISPGFFETMGVPLKKGRFFTSADALAANEILFAFGHRQTPP